LYSSGLAVLNISSFREVTIRFFEAFAAGRVVVTNELSQDSGLGELFLEGKHFFTYRDKENLLEVVTLLREMEVQVRNFGESAHQLVYEQHRSIHRAQKLVNVIEGLK
jgi:spore maturation protein CgeB